MSLYTNPRIKDPRGAQTVLEELVINKFFSGIANLGNLQTGLEFYLAGNGAANLIARHYKIPRILDQERFIVEQADPDLEILPEENFPSEDSSRLQSRRTIIKDMVFHKVKMPRFSEYHLHAVTEIDYRNLAGFIGGILPNLFLEGYDRIHPDHEDIMRLYVGQGLVITRRFDNLKGNDILAVTKDGLHIYRRGIIVKGDTSTSSVEIINDKLYENLRKLESRPTTLLPAMEQW